MSVLETIAHVCFDIPFPMAVSAEPDPTPRPFDTWINSFHHYPFWGVNEQFCLLMPAKAETRSIQLVVTTLRQQACTCSDS